MREEFDRITALLEQHDIPFETKEHGPVHTSQEASQVRGVPIEWGVKAMILKGPKDFFLVDIRADKKVDFKFFKTQEGKVRLATPEEVLRLTNCEIGSVPPFGFPRPIRTYLDREILDQEKITFNAGLLTHSVIMPGKDLLKVIDPILFS